MKLKYRRQSPVKGGREALPSCVIKDILRAVEHDSRYHRVSKSFVIAVILAKHYRIEEQETYLPVPLYLQKRKQA